MLGLAGVTGSGAALGRNMWGPALERQAQAGTSPEQGEWQGEAPVHSGDPLLVVPRGGNLSFTVCLTVKILTSLFYWSC